MNYSKVAAGALVLAVLGTSACSSSSSGGEAKSSDKKYTIAYSSPYTGNTYQNTFQCGMVAAAKESGVTLQISGSSAYAPATQIPVIQAAAAKKPDAMVLSPTDATALAGPLRQIKEAGTKIVLYDAADIYKGIVSAAVTADHYNGGVEAAQALVKVLGENGVVLPIDIAAGNPGTNLRVKGFRAEIAKHPGIKVLDTQYDALDPSKDAAIVDATLAAHPDLTAIVPIYNDAARAVVTALQANGKLSGIKIVTFDADPVVIKELKEGSIQAVVNQAPYAQATAAMKLAIEAVKGEKIDPSVVEIPMPVVTKENVDDPAISREFYVSKGCTN